MSQAAIKILYIEDDLTDAELMQEILHSGVGKSNQYNVVHVESLKAALNQIASQGFDAVLLDLNLKDISGMDNILAIKEENPDLPVIVLSGVDSDAIALDAIDHGAQEYVMKGHCDGKIIRLAIQSSIKRKAVERRLFKQANYDPLTGLPNRTMFQDYVEKAICKAERWKRHETVMFVDLDYFKKTNDTYGHDAGNAVLKEAAIRMKTVLRESDIVARYGGDEFTILLDDRSDDSRSAAGQAVTKLIYAFHAPFEYEGNSIDMSASIGIATYPASGSDFRSLIKSADKAMYKAKKAGGHQFCFADV